MTYEKVTPDSFKKAVQLIYQQRRLLADAGADGEVMSALDSIIKHLNKLTARQIQQMIGGNPSQQARLLKEGLARELASLSLEEIEKRLNDNELSRPELEAIAIGRFHVPIGSMRSIGNVQRLKERLWTFIQNERTHRTISQLAQSEN